MNMWTSRYDGFCGITEHIMSMSDMAAKLKGMEMAISDDFLVHFIMWPRCQVSLLFQNKLQHSKREVEHDWLYELLCWRGTETQGKARQGFVNVVSLGF